MPSAGNSAVLDADDRTLTITRIFDAPRALVWKAYTEKDRLAKWWGPQGFTWKSATLDFKPGGMFHYGMVSPQGQEMWGKFSYREIVPQEKLVFTSSFSDPSGATLRAPFAANFPLEILNTVIFSEHAGKTTLAMTGTPFNASEEERKFFASMNDSMNQGFKGTLDQLEAYLKTA